jgi:hypothetical protein
VPARERELPQRARRREAHESGIEPRGTFGANSEHAARFNAQHAYSKTQALPACSPASATQADVGTPMQT